MNTKNCLVCNKSFQKPYTESLKCWATRHKYCSKECANKAPRSEETRHKMRLRKVGKTTWNKGISPSEKTRKLLSQAFLGRKLSEETKNKMLGRRPWNKIGNGITSINERIRKSPRYKEWRRRVFIRDNYTCQDCGKHGGNLQVDHIKPFALFPELRFDINNGRTLCIPCHRKTESYGKNPHTHKGWHSGSNRIAKGTNAA